MPFNILTFALGKAIASNQGVSDQRATQLGVVGGILPLGLVPTILITRAIAQREAPPAAPPTDGTVLVDVPDVTNKTIEQASNILLSLNLATQLVAQASDTVAKGSVISQNPAAGLKVAAGSIVTLAVSFGSIVQVPEVTNKPIGEAEAILKERKLTVRRQDQPSETVPKDMVISQDPVAGQKVLEESEVTLVVSIGRPETVPDFIGKTEDEAKNLADKNKLVLERQNDEPSTPENKGKVIKQDPLKDQPVPADRNIKVTFGTDQPPVP